MKKIKDWLYTNRRILTFFMVVIASILLNIKFFNISHSAFAERQNAIIVQLDSHIKKSEKVLDGIVKYVPAQSVRIDSLYADLQSKMIGQIEQQKVFQESVKTMMEMEYAKIQNEYESQEIWIGLITIVFLIFSFYSMMKSEQFERQCQEDAKRVHELTESAVAKIEGINTAKEAKLKEIDEGFKNWKETSIIKITSDTGKAIKDELNSTKQERDVRYKEIEDKWESNLSAKVKRVMADLSTFEEESKKKCDARVEELLSVTEKKVMMEVKRILDNFDNDLSNVNGLIDKRIDKYMEDHTATSEDIDKRFEEVFGQEGSSKETLPEQSADKNETGKATKSDTDHEE